MSGFWYACPIPCMHAVLLTKVEETGQRYILTQVSAVHSHMQWIHKPIIYSTVLCHCVRPLCSITVVYHCGLSLWSVTVFRHCDLSLCSTAVFHHCGLSLCSTTVLCHCVPPLWSLTVFHPCGLSLCSCFVQGPLEETCSDFWQMVWEQNAPGIVMLSQFKELVR